MVHLASEEASVNRVDDQVLELSDRLKVESREQRLVGDRLSSGLAWEQRDRAISSSLDVAVPMRRE